MKENSLYDQKSLRSVIGKTADFKELAKDCVAFSNAQGGTIDIGIENNQTLPPANQKVPDGLTTQIENRIAGLTNSVAISAERCKAKNDSEYIQLHVARSQNAVSTTSTGKIYLRIGDKSIPVGSEELSRLVEDKGCMSWEDVPTRYDWHDADTEKLEDFIKQIKASDRVSTFVKHKDTKEILDYFYLTESESDRLTNLGVLFLGKQPQRGRIQNAPIIQCIKYDQYGEKVNKWLWDDYMKNPVEMVAEIWENIPEWRESTEISDGLFRRNIPAYPEKVIRELLVNALVHRPYTIKGDIFINIYPNHIDVTNPGRLPLGVTAENILHTTKKRNDHMANIFYVLHLMEREGSGYDMMYETLLANGKNTPIVIEGDDSVRVEVERKIVNQEMIKVMHYAEQRYHLKQKQLICLGIIALHESVTGVQLVKHLHLSNSDKLRSWLMPLIESGLVRTTEDKTRKKEYRVNSQLLKDSHYQGRTTLKRVENYRIKELVIEDLKIYKEANLKEIHSRIGEEIPSRKIWEQLSKLISEGKVKTIGQSRWRKYAIIE